MSLTSSSCTTTVGTKRPHEDDPLESYHRKRLVEWNAVESTFFTAMSVPFGGMISEVDAARSLRAHRDTLVSKGYAFGTYHTDRSLFEKLNRLVFATVPDAHMGRAVFHEVKSILRQIHAGSKPERNSFSMLVMMDATYVPPLADLVRLLSHPDATPTDLDLFWELTDRLWCFAHPVYTELHSGYLDETCAKIRDRWAEVGRSPQREASEK